MTHTQLIKKLRSKLKDEGRLLKWFLFRYVPEVKYATAMAQIAGNNPLSPVVVDGIKKYLNTEG
jgi:hypothetical protein